VRAIEDYRQALALDKTYRDAYNNLGLALSDLGEFDAAVQAYTQAITVDARDWHAYNNRGLALWALGRREDARRDYEKVKQLLGS
jgi:superkiller protein 3